MSRTAAAVVVTAALLAAFCRIGPDLVAAQQASAPASQAARPVMPIFGILDRLIALPRFSPDDVARVTGVALTEVPTSNEFFRIYKGSAKAAEFSSVEVRYKLPAASATAGDLVILTPSTRAAITSEDLARAYGPPQHVEPASPTAPPDAPDYYRVQRGSVRVSFGITRIAPVRLTKIVLDRSPR
jgi:hypothetical protein